MTNQEFYRQIKEIIKKCKTLYAEDGGYNITRGQAKVSSGDIEDLFALFIAKKIDDTNLVYWVDKTISSRFEKGKRAKSFRPDLAIINSDNVLTDYFDLKTNLGWMRDIEKFVKKKDSFISQLKTKKGWISSNSSATQKIKFSENLKYKIVVIYDGNISKKQMAKNIKIVDDLENVELYLLHNHQRNEINDDEFKKLYENLNVMN